MNTLESPPVASLLTRLYADAEESRARMLARLGNPSREERLARMSDANADYRAYFSLAKDVHMPVGRETGMLLYMLARGNGARAIVEFGTSFGLSALHLAAALRDNGGGRLIGSDFEPTKVAHARANLESAGLADLVEIREGDALETLARELPERIDLVLLDGHKPLYGRILALLAPRLRAGSYVVADNADACPEFKAAVRTPGSGYLSIPFGDEVELSMKL